MKPGVSLQRTGRLPALSAHSYAVSTAASLERRARTISTSGSTGAGLKKCMPTTRSGRSVASAISDTDSAEVFVASTASGRVMRSSSPKSSRFASSSSTIASTIRSQSASSETSVVSVSLASAASRSPAVSRSFSTARPR